MIKPNATLTLVLGGARSGKSRYGESLAVQSGNSLRYIATAGAYDDEMTARIAAHKLARAQHGWQTIEEQIDLAGMIENHAAADTIVFVDCLTLWLSNIMLAEQNLEHEQQRLFSALKAAKGPLILISNEVGMGLVPETPLGRAFRDAQGRLNQSIAALADRVIFVAAGLPLVLK